MSSVAQIDKFTLQGQLCWSQESQGTTIESRSWNGMMELGNVPWRSHICRICGLGTSNLESWNNFKKHQMWSKNRTTQSLSWWRILCGSQGKNDRLWKCRFLVCPQLGRRESWVISKVQAGKNIYFEYRSPLFYCFSPMLDIVQFVSNLSKYTQTWSGIAPKSLQYSIFWQNEPQKQSQLCFNTYTCISPPPGIFRQFKMKKWI